MMQRAMKNKSQKKPSQEFRLPEELQAQLDVAIQNLEEFTKQNEEESFPHIQNIDVKNRTLVGKPRSALVRTMNLIASLSTPIRMKHKKKRMQVQNTLLESVD